MARCSGGCGSCFKWRANACLRSRHRRDGRRASVAVGRCGGVPKRQRPAASRVHLSDVDHCVCCPPPSLLRPAAPPRAGRASERVQCATRRGRGRWRPRVRDGGHLVRRRTSRGHGVAHSGPAAAHASRGRRTRQSSGAKHHGRRCRQAGECGDGAAARPRALRAPRTVQRLEAAAWCPVLARASGDGARDASPRRSLSESAPRTLHVGGCGWHTARRRMRLAHCTSADAAGALCRIATARRRAARRSWRAMSALLLLYAGELRGYGQLPFAKAPQGVWRSAVERACDHLICRIQTNCPVGHRVRRTSVECRSSHL